MNIITSNDFHLKNTAVALGKFEGIHRGHQLLLNTIKEEKKNQRQSVVFTFDIPPRQALSGDQTYFQIYTRKERHAILREMGMDVLIEYPFTRDFAALSPDEFIRQILVGKAGAKLVVVGTDFRFGKGRSGGVEDLKRLSDPLGYELIVIDKLQENHKDISSSRIRSLMEEGSMQEAARLLGRPWSISGPVVHGKALGRTIGIPTANQLPAPHKLLPPNGVYVTKVILGAEEYYGITNVGVRPTVDQTRIRGVETFLFDFDRDIYGEEIKVCFLHYCRPEKKFSGIEDLKKQMEEDINLGKDYVKEVTGMNTIITIGRQYGSGGKEIGRKLAEYYGIPFYDKELLKIAAKESGLCEEMFESYDEKPTPSFLYSLVMDPYSLTYNAAGFEMPLNQKVFLAAFDTIKKLADQGPCVIVGRCADYALKDYDQLFNVFIQAPMDFKFERIRDEYQIPEDKIKSQASQMDKQRASYYNYYTSRKWGDARSYDLCIDSSVFGIDGTVELIKKAVALKENKNENK